MDVNAETLELIESRLSEKVERQVRDRLFKYYQAIWAVALVALTVLGYKGYNVISGLEETAKEYAESAVVESVQAAKKVAQEALNQASAMSAQLKAIDDFQKQRLVALLEAENRAIENQVKVEGLKAANDQKLQSINDDLEEARAQLEAISQRAKDGAGQGDIDQLATNVVSIGEQVKLVSEAVRMLESRAGVEAESAVSASNEEQIATILDKVKAQVGMPSPAAATVYFQFAGVRREVAVAISRELEVAGYTMPGEERTASAAGLHEVRYFFDADRERAERLVAEVNRALSSAGYRPQVVAQNFTGYRSKKPGEGTLELWLEPVPET